MIIHRSYRGTILVFLVVMCLSSALHAKTDSLSAELHSMDVSAKDSILSSLEEKIEQSPITKDQYIGLLKLGRSARYALRYDKSLNLLQKALTKAKVDTNLYYQGCILYELGSCHNDLGMENKALDDLFRSLQCFEQVDSVSQQSLSLNLIGIIKKNQGFPDEAIDYLIKSLTLRQSINDLRGIAASLNNIGSAYKQKGEYATAKDYFLKAIEINKELGNKAWLGYNYNNLANIYEETNDLENALIYHKKGLSLKAEAGDFRGEAVSHLNLAIVFLKQGNESTALDEVEIALKLAKDNQNVEVMPDALAYKGLILSKLGQYKLAFATMQRLSAFRDSIEAADRQVMISQIEAEYQQDKVEAENELLKNNLELNEAKMKRKDTFVVSLIACIGMLVLIVIMYSISTNQRNVAHRKLEQQTKALLDQKAQIEAQKKIVEDANLRLEKARAEKDLLLSAITHDMRNPLGAISTITGVLMDNITEKQFIEHLQVVDFSATNLLNLVNDLLDYAKMETGNLKLGHQDFELCTILNSLLPPFQFMAAQKNIEFKVALKNTDKQTLKGDPTRLSQVIYNLLGNAIKFTTKGSVTFSAELERIDNKNALLSLSVTDTGIGIPADQVENIFDFYTQANDKTSRMYGGSGLGLAISKQIVEMQGGKITVESSEEKGSTFYVRIPYVQAELGAVERH